jgi:hypothetical protein
VAPQSSSQEKMSGTRQVRPRRVAGGIGIRYHHLVFLYQLCVVALAWETGGEQRTSQPVPIITSLRLKPLIASKLRGVLPAPEI